MSSDDKTTLASASATPGDLPERIGRYRLLGPIGEGGFGVVYEAEQTEPVRRRVALKVIKLGMDTKQVVARFEAERQALAMMDHPNIARVLDAGATDSGRPFFVMELVRGEPITGYCDKNTLPVADRLRLFRLVCQAVQHAHQKGVIHRDLKPSNILITLHDGHPVPKVIDFGIAKAISQRLTEKTVYTEQRQMIGTPEYMSPEQAEMSGIDIDTRSDIYSLGVLLYELIIGVTPFDAKQLRAAGYGEIQRIIREETPPKPSTRLTTLDTRIGVAARRHTEPKKLALLIRGDLDWIVMKALEKDRTRRYETANGFADDVQRYLDNQPVVASPPTVGYRMRKFVRRNRAAVAALTMVGTALMLGIVGTSWGMLRALRAAEAEAAAKREAEQVAAFQAEQLGGIDVSLMATRLRADLIARRQEYLASRAEMTDKHRAALLDEFERSLIGLDLVGSSLSLLEENVFEGALRAIDVKYADHPLFQARMLHTLAGTMTQLGLPKRAEAIESRALAIRKAELGNDHPDTLASVSGMGKALADLARWDESVALHREALEGRRRVLGDDHPDTLESMHDLGATLLHLNRPAEAEQFRRGALEGRRRVLGDKHPDTLKSINNMAIMMAVNGNMDEAERLLREALDAQPGQVGSLPARQNLARIAGMSGRYAEAEHLYREGFELARSLLGDDHPTTLVSAHNYISSLLSLGRYAEADGLSIDTLQRYRRLLGDDSVGTLASETSRADVLIGLDRYSEAEPLARSALAGLRNTGAPGTIDALRTLAEICLKTGRPGEALAYAQACVDGDAHYQNYDPWNQLQILARAQHATGDPGAAVETQRRAIASLPEGFAYQPTIDVLNERLRTYEAALESRR